MKSESRGRGKRLYCRVGVEYRSSFSEVSTCRGLVLLCKFSRKMKVLDCYQRVTSDKDFRTFVDVN